MCSCVSGAAGLYYLKPNKTENLLERFGPGHGKGRGTECMLLSISVALNTLEGENEG